MPVSVMNGSIAITPAAREALSPDALEFAVVQGIVEDRLTNQGAIYRRVGVMLLGLLVAWAVERAGASRVLGFVAFLVTTTAALAAVASVRSKWPSPRIDQAIVQALPNMDGARAYAQVTDRQNLNGEHPEAWANAHEALVDLARLERAPSVAR